jgi:hypothetical protein
MEGRLFSVNILLSALQITVPQSTLFKLTDIFGRNKAEFLGDGRLFLA